MLYQSFGQTYKMTGLTQAARDAIINASADRVLATSQEDCVPKTTPASTCYTVIVRSPPGQESTDLAKQLLILIGTLMTSVTSFYFAARSGVSATTAGAAAAAGSPTPEDGGEQEQSGAADTQRNANANANANAGADSDGSAADGCDVVVTQANATPDEQLPAAEGGVQR
jgi:hypothetical protein